MDVAEYCREIETYLCRKNDGHLIRVVGPSFERVARWAEDGVPLKIAFRGIDRYFERYYRQGPRRRPVRIDFCEADVLDLFDQWRRAIGLTASRSRGDASAPTPERSPATPARGSSLSAHLERVLARLTGARISGALGAEADIVLDRVSGELDAARASARGLRGAQRTALLERLAALDREVIQIARHSLDERARTEVERDADEELVHFRHRMAPQAFERARQAAIERLVRERLGLPVIALP